jgi:hypothetical protein
MFDMTILEDHLANRLLESFGGDRRGKPGALVVAAPKASIRNSAAAAFSQAAFGRGMAHTVASARALAHSTPPADPIVAAPVLPGPAWLLEHASSLAIFHRSESWFAAAARAGFVMEDWVSGAIPLSQPDWTIKGVLLRKSGRPGTLSLAKGLSVPSRQDLAMTERARLSSFVPESAERRESPKRI